jgi:hypothetical protein
MVRNLLILSLKVALHVDDAIYFVCFACMQHACDPTNATIFSFARMPTSLFLFCSLHGRCDDLLSIATAMHNHTPVSQLLQAHHGCANLKTPKQCRGKQR